MNNGELAVQARNVTKTFEKGRIIALKEANLEVKTGEFLAVMGPSGSGKSTLLNLIGAMDLPDSGEIWVDSELTAKLKDAARFRARSIGFIFQLHNLIPTLTAKENVQIPMFEMGWTKRKRREEAKRLLTLVDLGERTGALPIELSGGERQRVAIARALANGPNLILADEPTGNLDSESSHKIMELLKEIQKKKETTIVLVTHDPDMAEHAQRAVFIKDGRITKNRG